LIESKLAREIPLLMIALGIGIVGFALAVGWGKATGKTMDRATVVFLAKVFGGIALFGMALAFIL
jgi:hypothetical protein